MNEEFREQPNTDAGVRPKRRTPKESQNQIGDMAIRMFKENPAAFWSFSPELANAVEQHLQSSGRDRARVPVFEGYMTEREREFKLQSLTELIEQYKEQGTLPLEDAQRSLSLAAALREHAAPHKTALMEIVERVIGVPLDSPTPEKVTLVKGKPEHHNFELVRGLKLSLTWDGELLAIALDPKEYQRRRKALSFVGIASDPQPDVAENHDAYLWANPDEG